MKTNRKEDSIPVFKDSCSAMLLPVPTDMNVAVNLKCHVPCEPDCTRSSKKPEDYNNLLFSIRTLIELYCRNSEKDEVEIPVSIGINS